MLFGVFWLIALLASLSVGLLLCWFSGLLVVCWSAVWPQFPRHGTIFLFDGWMDGQIPRCIDTYMQSYTDLDGLFGVF